MLAISRVAAKVVPIETHLAGECKSRSFREQRAWLAKVFGTVLLSVPSEHRRYAHINAVRSDGVNPGLLAIDGTMRKEVVRQSMIPINETHGLEWLN